MTKTLQSLQLTLLALFAIATLSAQDLSSQRGESQSLGTLLGEKLDHQGLVINPTPQSLERLDGELDLSAGVALSGKASLFADDIDFLPIAKRGVKLDIRLAPKAFDAALLPGAYKLNINAKGIAIVAADELGAFYALQTLRQVVESPISKGGKLPYIAIDDFADLPCRGVVEGFYGAPWSHEVRLSLIEIYGRYKLNYYIYGPKDDPYHSSPNWRQPYPEAEANNIKELTEACRRNRVHFVWAIHPGQDIKWNEEDYQNLVNKFEAMYSLGVRAFAIHFDDISGEGTNPLKQTELLNRLNEEFVARKGDVEPLIVCPTDYTRLWANPTERGSLVVYGKTLHPSVDVFWTGDAVCSDLTAQTMEWVGSRIQRPALYWWNYPVTDYARHIIMQGPVYGLDATMTREKTRGIVSNPMEHGEASKLALYSVADYAWNTEAYNPIDSWERAIEAVAPEVKDAYRTFAIHSCDTETGYRRLESWETETFAIDDYSPEKSAALMAQLRSIEALPEQMEAMQNKALLEELRPWIVELSKLGRRCRKALEMLDRYHDGKSWDGFWDAYVDNLMSDEEVAMYDAHRAGTMKLKPFYERTMDGLVMRYYESCTGNKASTLAPCGSYVSLRAPQSKYMFDNDPETYYHSGQGQRTDDFVGVDMGIVRPVREVLIVQGRNSTDDVDYFDHAIVEYSLDGETWHALTDEFEGVYDIRWKGEPIEARYVGLRKLPSSKRNWLAIRAFEINPVTPDRFAEDGNPFTKIDVEGDVRFDIAAGTTLCQLLIGDYTADARYRVLNAEGEAIAEQAITSAYQHIALDAQAAAIELSGVESLYEIALSK